MNDLKLIWILLIVCLILINGCKNSSSTKLPNPASVYCEEQKGIVNIKTNQDGSQTGYCTFPNGSECEEWAYYRGECEIGK